MIIIHSRYTLITIHWIQIASSVILKCARNGLTMVYSMKESVSPGIITTASASVILSKIIGKSVMTFVKPEIIKSISLCNLVQAKKVVVRQHVTQSRADLLGGCKGGSHPPEKFENAVRTVGYYYYIHLSNYKICCIKFIVQFVINVRLYSIVLCNTIM